VKGLLREHPSTVSEACELFGLSRSSYYYQSQRAAEGEDRIREAVKAAAADHVLYGSRRLTHQLGREPYQVHINRKRTQRIMRQLELLRPVKRRKIRTTNSEHPYPRYPNLVAGLKVSLPDEVWVSDITYVRLGQGFVYLAVTMDVFTRAIRGWDLSHLIDQDLALNALRMGLQNHCPTIHHSDQGVQYASTAYVAELQAHQVQISMAHQGKPEENGYAERLMRTIKEEEVDLSDYRNFQDAFKHIQRFIEDVYMTKRIHSALGYLTPREFEAAHVSNKGTP
jgi:putative transposase